VEDDRYELENSEGMKHSKGVDESHHQLVQCEGQVHPFRSGCGAYSFVDICDVNKNLHKNQAGYYVVLFNA
jgi:hypothetical protein